MTIKVFQRHPPLNGRNIVLMEGSMFSRGTLRLPVYILSAVDAYQKDTDTVKELSVLKYCGKFNEVKSYHYEVLIMMDQRRSAVSRSNG